MNVSDHDLHAAERRIGNDATRTNGSDPTTFREGAADHEREPPLPPEGIRPDLPGENGNDGAAGGVGKSL